MSTIGSLSGGPACEPAKLIIEVVGLDHPAGQRLLLAEHGSQQPVVINKQPSKEVLEDENYSSTLHIWPWDDEPPCDVWLEIDTTSGAPIRLPLAENIAASPRQQDGQWNQIAPVVPMTMVRSGTRPDDKGIPVLTRPGYLYVFYQGGIWRELEIRQTEEGTFYHDIDLRAWRSSGSPEGGRVATGLALEEVWLPARWNNIGISDMQLAYSEVQWTAPRIKRLEGEATARTNRCQQITVSPSRRVFDSMASGSDGRNLVGGLLASLLTNNAAGVQAAANAEARRRSIVGKVFPLSFAEPQRRREELHEYLFNEPAAFLLNLEGEYPQRCMEHADQTLHAYLSQQTAPRGEVETDAITICMERLLISDSQADEQDTNGERLTQAESSWLAAPAATDVLQNARVRKITGVLVEDGFYRMRQLRDRMTALQSQLMVASDVAGKQEHFASALLVDNYILSDSLGGRRNPLHRYADTLDGPGISKVRRTLAGTLKRNVSERHDQARNTLAACLEAPYFLETLADAFSQNGIEYGCSFSLTAQMILAASSALKDPLKLMPPRRPTPADRFIVRFQQDDHPLRAMLLPPTSLEACMQPYLVPQGQEHNEGDGCFRPQALAQIETTPLPDAQSLMLLEARVLVSSARSDVLNSMFTAGLSRSLNLSLAIAANVQSALTQAHTRLRELGLQIRQAGIHVAEVTTTRDNIRRSGAYPVKMDVFELDSVSFARSIAPGMIGPVHAYRTGNLAEANRELLLLHQDLMGSISEGRRITGHLYGDDNRTVATSNPDLARSNGFATTKHERLLWVAPRTAQMATLYERLGVQVAQATRAEERVLASAGEMESLKRTGKARKRALKTLRSPLLPPLLVGIEVYNLATVAAISGQMERERGQGRVLAGTFLAAYDVMLATHLLAERVAHDTVMIRRTAQALDMRLFRNPLAGNVRIFAIQVTGRILLGAVGAVATSGLALWDAMDAFKHGDNSGWGHLVVASGGAAMLLSVFMAGPAAASTGVAAFMGPAGWALAIGVGLVMTGMAIASWLSDEPIEQWLKLGPFGSDNIDGLLWLRGEKPSHLQNAQEAFYRLVSLLVGIRIQIGPNPHQADALRTQPSPGNEARYYAMRRAATRIRITSNVSALMTSSESSHMRIGVSMTETTMTTFSGTAAGGGVHYQTSPLRNKQQEIDTRCQTPGVVQGPASFIVFQEPSLTGLDLYVEEPSVSISKRSQQTRPGTVTIAFGWAVRVQLITEENTRQSWVFPAPDPKDPLQYNPARHNRIDYIRTGQVFWADEKSNAAERII